MVLLPMSMIRFGSMKRVERYVKFSQNSPMYPFHCVHHFDLYLLTPPCGVLHLPLLHFVYCRIVIIPTCKAEECRIGGEIQQFEFGFVVLFIKTGYLQLVRCGVYIICTNDTSLSYLN
jgi:hypothetical protein